MANELVRTSPAGAANLPALPPGLTGDATLLGDMSCRLVTSLKMDDPSDQLLFLAAQDKSENDGRRGAGQILICEHFLLRDANRRSVQTKELEPCKLLTLISPDGEVWSTTSEPAIRSFFMLASLRGLPPWKGGRKLRIKPIRTSLGTDTYVLTEDYPNGPASKSKKHANG